MLGSQRDVLKASQIWTKGGQMRLLVWSLVELGLVVHLWLQGSTNQLNQLNS